VQPDPLRALIVSDEMVCRHLEENGRQTAAKSMLESSDTVFRTKVGFAGTSRSKLTSHGL